MGWAGGAMLAEEIWDIVRGYIPKDRRPGVAKRIIEAFRAEDWDTVDEAETLATTAKWYNKKKYDALQMDDGNPTPKPASAD